MRTLITAAVVFYVLVSCCDAESVKKDLSAGDRRSFREAKFAIRDEPIQLVRPDGKHRKLVVVEENIELLHNIKSPLAIVAVVGKFHSGKSFLMNQLMGKDAGFGIGPSVQPMTMGIWMWGQPAKIRTKNDEEINVIFLDTEGFAANNVSENYDAKVFAVATILSSHLLYNSVKIIDQGDIDYLELLARRTQLFALRSQMSRSKWIKDFNEDLLSFPPLTWIVQDFFQDVVDQELVNQSPKEWLIKLMSSHVRENEQYEISILDIFKDVDCHTLFLPATKRHLLNDLSKATEEDLTDEYKEERDHLISKLEDSIKPKKKSNRYISGAEVGHLLRVLVHAANEGSLADVPSRWEAFVERLQSTATEDCLKFYDDEMTSFIDVDNFKEPVKVKHLLNYHETTMAKSEELIAHVLQGLDDALKSGLDKLRHKIELSYGRISDLNQKKISLKLNEISNLIAIKFEEQLTKLHFPMASGSFGKNVRQITDDLISEATKLIAKVIEVDESQPIVTGLTKSLEQLSAKYELKNNEAIQVFLQSVLNEAVIRFNDVIKSDWSQQAPLKPSTLDSIKKTAIKDAHELFNERTKLFESEGIYPASQALLKELLQAEVIKVEEVNQDIAKKHIQNVVTKLKAKFHSRTGSEAISLPVFDDTLDTKLKTEIANVLKDYETQLNEFAVYDAYAKSESDLQIAIGEICDLRRKQNIEAFTKEVQKPLESAKRIIMLSTDKYSTVFSFKQFVRSACLINLDDGKPKSWPTELKLQIINNFINNDVEISRAIKAKEGYWSNFVGFVEWILWCFGLIS